MKRLKSEQATNPGLGPQSGHYPDPVCVSDKHTSVPTSTRPVAFDQFEVQLHFIPIAATIDRIYQRRLHRDANPEQTTATITTIPMSLSSGDTACQRWQLKKKNIPVDHNILILLDC